jgi:hypothetical protein
MRLLAVLFFGVTVAYAADRGSPPLELAEFVNRLPADNGARRAANVMGMLLAAGRDLLDCYILSKLGEPIREFPELRAGLLDLMPSVRAQGFEGLVAKRRDSRYEPGQSSGAWKKMRINKGQEFVIAGYTLGGATFDAIIFGYYDESKLLYVSRTRNGFTPRLREDLLKQFRGLEITECPFANLPEARGGRWGQGLTSPPATSVHRDYSGI